MSGDDTDRNRTVEGAKFYRSIQMMVDVNDVLTTDEKRRIIEMVLDDE